LFNFLGFDVLTVRITPTQLLLPARVEPIVRNEILPTLFTSDHEKKLIHGFSVGGYVFARMLKYMQLHPEGRDLMRTMKAQIWDSVVDVNGVSIGVSKSVFGNQQPFQQALQGYIEFHMRAMYRFATKYYVDAHHYYYKKPLQAPALFLNSEADMISTMDVIEEVQRQWKDKGIRCDNQVWRDTAHVGHMRAYPDEYKEILKDFLNKHGMHKEERRRVISHHHHDLPIGIPNVV
jgi:pimeloyl-ACP methyl ester carboxylesterase